MKGHPPRLALMIFVAVLAAGLTLAPALAVFAQDDVLEAASQSKEEALAGWERDSKYNSFYNMETFDKLKGFLVDIIEVTPLEGMAPGIAVTMELKEGDSGMGEPDEIVTMHFGPKPHVRFMQYMAVPGDKLTVRGSWAEINGEKVFMASKVKVNEAFEFKVRRTSDGTPYWNMTKEELLEERFSD